MKEKYSIAELFKQLDALRNPVTGCPWNLQQDFASLAKFTLEEAYELVDAIDNNDINGLQGELGDLLYQVIYLDNLQ
jgi:ATP diphosphatase